jgi:hypothetical protein
MGEGGKGPVHPKPNLRKEMSVSDLRSKRRERRYPRGAWPQALVLLVSVVAALVLALYQFTVPAVVPAGAPATEFSAQRAMEDLEVIADEPRPVGSRGHAEARRYILQVLKTSGLDPRVQTTTAIEPLPEGGAAVAARVKNILVRLPGTSDSHSAVLLSAHYDSWSGATPGASDCGSCVVTLLETLRALEAGPPLKHDVIFLFTDAEERISLGAKGFVEDDPWADDERMIFNFEGAGSHGPVMILQTTEPNGRLVDGLLEAAPHPMVDSFLPFMFGKVAGGDDMEVYKTELGATGLDFVYFMDRSVYHTAVDNLQTIDPRSVQHDGSYALALTRHFGNASLENLNSPNETFFTILPGLSVHYPEVWSLPLAVLLALAFLAVVALGLLRGRLAVGKLVVSILVSLLVLLGSFAATTLLWVLVEALNPGYEETLVFSTVVTYNGPFYLIAFAAFTVALAATLYALLETRFGFTNLAAGAMFWWVVLCMLTGLYAQGIGYLLTWPLAFGLLALGWTIVVGEREVTSWGVTAIGAIAAFAGVLIFAPTVYILFNVMGVAQPGLPVPVVGAPMLLVALLVGVLLPQLALLSRVSKWLVPGLAGLVCLAFLGAGQLTSGFDTQHPKPNAVSYELNADTGKAMWKSPGRNLDGWTSQFFPRKTYPASYAGWMLPGLMDLEGVRGPAPPMDLTPPTVERLSDTTKDGERTLRLRVASPRGAPNVAVRVEAPGDIVSASIDGKKVDRDGVPEDLRGLLAFSYSGVPEDGFELSLTTDSAGPVKTTVQDISEGLPDVPGMEIEPRSSWMMPLQAQAMDPTKVQKSFVFEGGTGP